jgi:diaminopimelate decarboxylase
MSDPTAALVRKYFSVSGEELFVGDVPARVLAETYGTPVFVYDQAIIDAKLRALRSALPDRFVISYSVKANPAHAILHHFLQNGCGLEIASAGEFHHALRAGCDPRNILFAGPGKTEAELELVLSHRIGEIHLESLTETRRVASICARLGMRQRVALRVNPAGEAEGGAMRMGGRPAPFGVDEETLDEILDVILAESALDFCGIHLFTGTQILEAAILVNQYRHGLEIARRVVKRIGRPLKRVDFGGGLGIPYFAHEKELDLEQLRDGLSSLFAGFAEDKSFSGTQFLVEPGRFLAAEAGVYLARVNDIKISRGKKFLILDGGMNHHLAASGNLGQTIKRNYPVALANKLDSPAKETVDVVGPLCTPLDTLARGVSLPEASIGDLFVIFQSGAYARAASPLNFLSHATPPEVWVNSQHHALIQPRGHFGDETPALALPFDNAHTEA